MHKTLSIGVVGLGRMGARHALNLLLTPRCRLTAAFTPDPAEREWAMHHLAPSGTTVYSDYASLLAHPGLEAVLIAASTAVHPELALGAIAAGKHVLVEKPLSTKLAEAAAVVKATKEHPELKVMVGFSRRFDASYLAAKKHVDDGKIGDAVILRSQTCDRRDDSGYFVSYSQASGGIFVDCSIHDIDLSLLFLGEDIQPKALWATGICAVHPELKELGDADNAVGVVEFWGGKMAYFYASRMMAHGQEDSTEIIGTDGKVRVNMNPSKDLVEFCEKDGVRRNVPTDYWGRFQGAFAEEVRQYVDCVLDDTPLPLRIDSAYKALEIGSALQESLITGKKLDFDERGRRVN